MRTSREFLTFILILGFWMPAARADFETPIAITNIKIVSASGEVIENGTVVIESAGG